jgi:hypothetical protein
VIKKFWVAVGVLFTSTFVAVFGASAVSAATWDSGCSANRFGYDNPGTYYYFNTNVNGTLNGVYNGNSVTLTSIRYFMGYPTITILSPTPFPSTAWWGGTGSSNNVNVSGSGITRNSPDALGWGGTWDFVNFTVPRNSVVSVQFIPDITNMPDPSCTATFTVG